MASDASSDPRANHPRFFCADCDVDTYINQQYYVLHDELWEQVAPRVDSMLCLNCVEIRLGRLLNKGDFASVPLNQQQASVCPELFARLHRTA